MESVPLEKLLLHVDLSGGVNERDRAETADPSKTLTRVENLLQDQTNSFIKRPGMAILGNTVDDAGHQISTPTKLVRLKNGLGLVGNSGTMYHYQEDRQMFLKRGNMPDYVINGVDSIASTGGSSTSVYSVATSTRFHAMVADGPSGVTLFVYERSSGCIAGTYDMTTLASFSTKIAFVADRYLHVLMNCDFIGLRGFVIDTYSTLPINEAAITLTTLNGDDYTDPILDYAVHSDRSIALYQGAGTNMYLVSMLNTGALGESISTGITTYAISNSGDKLWVMDTTNLRAVSPTSMATVSVAAAAHGGTVGAMVATSDNYVYVVTAPTMVFGSSTIPTVVVKRTSASNGTTLSATHLTLRGWAMRSNPFEGLNRKVFIHLVKSSSDTVSPHAMVNITYGDQSVPTAPGGYTYNSARIACSIEPYLGENGTYSILPRYFSYDGYTVCPTFTSVVTARTYCYSMAVLKPYMYGVCGSASFGGSTHISGGCHTVYGGGSIPESGYVDVPFARTEASATSGPLTGIYNYVAVFKRVDETGITTYSRVSNICSLTLTAKSVSVYICPPCVTNADLSKSDGRGATNPRTTTTVEVYRTLSGGTQYYFVSSVLLASDGFYNLSDSMTDATLATHALLYRQPGTPNSSVDRYPPPPGNVICTHKDRVFTTDSFGTRVYYSSFFVDGEAAWYNPVFSFFVHGGSGPITGLVSMDGRLFVFKRDGIFVVDGDGPPEGGVTGNEFSPPSRLATEFGCISSRSICVTTEGIVYRSTRGIEILTRSLQVKWLGDRIQNTVDANPHTLGSTLDTFGRVHVLVASSEESAGRPTIDGVSGAELVYDVPANSWSVHYGTGQAGVYGRSLQDVCMADIDGLGEVIVYCDPTLGAMHADEAVGIDRSLYYVPWVIESGWFRTGQQARQRVSEIMFLAKKNAGANHAIKMSLAFNYSDTYTQTYTWQPTDLSSLSIEELSVQPSTQSVLAVRVKIEEIEPSATNPTTGFTAQLGTVLSYLSNIELGQYTPISYPVGTGRGCDVLGISVEIAPKKGMPKLASGQKA